MTITTISPEQLETLARQVDKRIPKDLSFFRYGDRLLQIKRYLIEHDLDISQTIMAIKRTAIWRKAWNADNIKPSDIFQVADFAQFTTCEATTDGLALVCLCFNPPASGKVPPIERVVEAFIFVMDNLLRNSYEYCIEHKCAFPIKDYGKLIVNAGSFKPSFLRQAFPLYPKTLMEILFCHYPCFLSLNDLYVTDDPNFVPNRDENSHTIYIQNAPYFIKGVFTILSSFFPERYARQICINTYLYLPPCVDPSKIPERNGGTYTISVKEWLQLMGTRMNCSIEEPTVHELSNRVLDMYGSQNKEKACKMSNAYARASLWKMTNAGHRWHHYYFVLTKENILYYFTDAEDTEVRTGILLENCKIEPDSSLEAIKREGEEAVLTSKNVTGNLHLNGNDVAEKKGGTHHRYHFILQTPGRPYTFACDTPEQRTAWMIMLIRAIDQANKEFNL